MDSALMDKLSKILALTKSPVEGEAAAATAMLQKLLTKHNLEVADLERRGDRTAPGVKEGGHDLGKAAFQWKLDLATLVAEHFFCVPIVRNNGPKSSTVAFVGRPDNVESLQMLYGWLIDQIKRISSETRKQQPEHIDPLRWQVNFGQGAVGRLASRMREIKKERERRATEEAKETMALVLHHDSENSDYLEEKYGYRTDGRPTKRELEREERYARSFCADRFIREFNHTKWLEIHPEETEEGKAAIEARRAASEAYWEAADKRSEASRKAAETRRARYGSRRYDYIKEAQAWSAEEAGREAGNKINLEPFLATGHGLEKIK